MNILNFPGFTLVNRVVPKVAFYGHLEVTARMKSAFVENVEQIIWLYKLAPSNLHVADGKGVHELTIFLVKLKREITDSSDIFRYIDSKLPRHTIFIIQQDNKYQLLVNYKQWKDASAGTFEIIKAFSTGWLSAEQLSLHLDSSSNMDTLYESLVRQIASTQIISSQQDLHQAVSQTIHIEAIKKEMAAIRKKELKEQQPQKKFALHQKYMQLKKKLEEHI
ncbi:MAG TPA: DUF4391 domain-containing protein [Prevotella sp.]|nr:DUF4391 domain-containing protein [Prevotella sp.]